MSGGQQMFNLRWNNFQSSISSALHEQLLGEELVDVTLSAEGRTVGAHRVVLSACSPYFKHLFKTLPAQQHPVVVIRDSKFSDIQTLLAFIYQGEVQVSNSALPSLLKTAEVLSIKGLTPSHLREEQPPPAPDTMVSWAEAFAATSPPVRARPATTDESPAKRMKPSADSSRTAGDDSSPAPLNLSASGSPPAAPLPAPPPQQQQQQQQLQLAAKLPATPRFTLKIPSLCGVPTVGDDTRSADASPRLDMDDGSWLDLDRKEGRNKPLSPPVISANSSPPDVASADGGPMWKNLLPKPNRRMLPVKCPECSKLISNAYNLRVHMDLHKHLTYLCSICSTPTRSRDTLRKHITNIHKVKGEALREMLDHGIVSTTPASGDDSLKEEPAEDELVVDEAAASPPPLSQQQQQPQPQPTVAVVEPPPPAAAATHC